ncbi:putative mediator of RNA polymerase II transcription subunit 15-like [Triplophysa rosa]|uniref:Mediator of RNA polymerase II transcription subunit 15 n=1 Tax=Triplophysa rosa TaxID=992332 RepID=A0A9W7WFY0_TRIRA|nr:putative mediator of RNA polymerase II transcription subunit 15-like [Triplophysa rosa]
MLTMSPRTSCLQRSTVLETFCFRAFSLLQRGRHEESRNCSCTDMENRVYIKAKTREEYLSVVARLIIHFRDIHKKTQGGPDPMNALQNLTGVGGGGVMSGMGPMVQMQMGQHTMQGVAGGQQAGSAGQMQMMQQSIQFQQFQTPQQAAMQPPQQTAMQQFQQMKQLNSSNSNSSTIRINSCSILTNSSSRTRYW